MPPSSRLVPACRRLLCIWLISATISELEGKTTIAAFRAVVIYSFALSFVVTAPIALVSARLISDKLHDREVAPVPGIMLSAILSVDGRDPCGLQHSCSASRSGLEATASVAPWRTAR